MRRDTLWIKDALNDMPAYLERVIQHVAANTQPGFRWTDLAACIPEVKSAKGEPALTDAETQRRTQRMKECHMVVISCPIDMVCAGRPSVSCQTPEDGSWGWDETSGVRSEVGTNILWVPMPHTPPAS